MGDNEKYSLEKTQDEAHHIKKKIESDEAHDYFEAEKQIDREYYQDLIWRHPTSEEVTKLSKEVHVNVIADTPISGPGNLLRYKDAKLVERSGTSRLIDLGSAASLFKDYNEQLDLEEVGIKEYIGVDLGVKNTEFKTRKSDEGWVSFRKKFNPLYQEPETDQRLRLKLIRKEILDALHSFPDSYANVWMTGIEGGNVLQNYSRWGFAVLAELKRIVPEKGFIFTDGGFVDDMLNKCIPNFQELRNVLYKLKYIESNRFALKYPGIIGKKGLSDEEIDQSINELKKQIEPYKCKKDDPFQLGIYVVDAPQIGFRIYFSDVSSWDNPIVIINVSKIKDTINNLEENPKKKTE